MKTTSATSTTPPRPRMRWMKVEGVLLILEAVHEVQLEAPRRRAPREERPHDAGLARRREARRTATTGPRGSPRRPACRPVTAPRASGDRGQLREGDAPARPRLLEQQHLPLLASPDLKPWTRSLTSCCRSPRVLGGRGVHPASGLAASSLAPRRGHAQPSCRRGRPGSQRSHTRRARATESEPHDDRRGRPPGGGANAANDPSPDRPLRRTVSPQRA